MLKREDFWQTLDCSIKDKDAKRYVETLLRYDFRQLSSQDMEKLESFLSKPDCTDFDYALETHSAAVIYYQKLRQANMMPYFSAQTSLDINDFVQIDPQYSTVETQTENQRSKSCLIC